MILDLKGNEVNPPSMPEARPMTEAEVETSQLKLQQFADGFIYKWTHHPTEEGRFVMFDVNNAPVAVVASAPVADLLCQAIRMLFHAVALAKSTPKPGTPDNLVAAANAPAPVDCNEQDYNRERAAETSPVMES